MQISGYPVLITIKVKPDEFQEGMTLEQLEDFLRKQNSGGTGEGHTSSRFLSEVFKLAKEYKAAVDSVSCKNGELDLCFTIADPDKGKMFANDAKNCI